MPIRVVQVTKSPDKKTPLPPLRAWWYFFLALATPCFDSLPRFFQNILDVGWIVLFFVIHCFFLWLFMCWCLSEFAYGVVVIGGWWAETGVVFKPEAMLDKRKS